MALAMFPHQPFSAVLKMHLAQTVDPCHLIRSAKIDDLSRQKSIFLSTSVSLTFVVVWYLLLPREIYFTAPWWLYDVHWAGSEKLIQEPASRPLASAPFILVLFFFSDLESFFFFSCDAICINNGILLFDWLCSLPKGALKCHTPSDDTFLATNKRCDAWGGQAVKMKTNLATVSWGDGLILFKTLAKHEATPAWCIFYLTEHFGGCSEKTLPKQRLAISSKTFFSKNLAHMKVKFGHFDQLVVLTDG